MRFEAAQRQIILSGLPGYSDVGTREVVVDLDTIVVLIDLYQVENIYNM